MSIYFANLKTVTKLTKYVNLCYYILYEVGAYMLLKDKINNYVKIEDLLKQVR